MRRRIGLLIWKEFLQLRRDPLLLRVILLMPVAQLEHERCGVRVVFGDARFSGGRIFGREVRNPFHYVVTVPQPGPGCDATVRAEALPAGTTRP